MKKQPKTKVEPVTHLIGLEPPVKIYTAKELAVMPLSQMLKCRDAQEEYYKRTFLTMCADLLAIKYRMEKGELIQMHCTQKRKRVVIHFELGGGKIKQTCNKSTCLPQTHNHS